MKIVLECMLESSFILAYRVMKIEKLVLILDIEHHDNAIFIKVKIKLNTIAAAIPSQLLSSNSLASASISQTRSFCFHNTHESRPDDNTIGPCTEPRSLSPVDIQNTTALVCFTVLLFL